jgi:beta-barrel assembly-enhancing protease
MPFQFNLPAIRHTLPVLAAAVLLTRCSCDLFGVAGSLFISEQDEVQLGTEFNSQLRSDPAAQKEYPIFVPKTHDDTVLVNYVQSLAAEVYAAVPEDQKPGYPFTFTLINADVENAFAVPGGYIYIYTGIIKKMEDESELAGVIGHEIAHVTQHHYRDALAKQAGLSLLVQALVNDDAGQITQLVAGSLFNLAAMGVSRGNETEADEYGTHFLANTQRNPLGIAKFFARFGDTGADWFSTHPAPDNRVETVKAQVNANSQMKALAAQAPTTDRKEIFLANTKALR